MVSCRTPSGRAATALLSQSHAALRNFEAALQGESDPGAHARLPERLEPVDLYNAGFFNLMLQRPTEAVALFRQSKEKANPRTPASQGIPLQHAGTAGHWREAPGGGPLQAGRPVTESKDWRKVVAANQQLAAISEEKGDTGAARDPPRRPPGRRAGRAQEERKGIRRKLDQLG